MNQDINDFINEFSLDDQNEINAKANVFESEMLEVINAETLKPIRKAFKNTQEDLAKKLGVGQVAISKLEGRSDVYVSTLRRYLEAVGASLQMTVKLKDGKTIPLERFGSVKNSEQPLLNTSISLEKAKPATNKEVRSVAKKTVESKVSTARQAASKISARKKIEA